MHKVTEIKEGSPCHLHRLIRGGRSRTGGSAMTHCPQKEGGKSTEEGKPQRLSLVRRVGSEVGPGGFYWRQIAQFLDARRKMLGALAPEFRLHDTPSP